MKCPKCGYLGFETSERCRNCGYDFSLAVVAAPVSELPLHSSHGGGSPLADFDLRDSDTPSDNPTPTALDLNRVIGAPDASDDPEPGPTRRARAPGLPAHGRHAAPSAPSAPSAPDLPLFSARDEDAPLITKPRPARPPLSVRRTTPEIPRTRPRSVTPRPEDGELAFPSETSDDEPLVVLSPERRAEPTDFTPAAAGSRVIASAIDLVLLGSINAAVVYLTLALSGLTVDHVRVLPLLPMLAFFAVLDGGYLAAFIAAGGQTIGKMMTGIRVVGDDGRRVDVARALLRAAGCGVSLLTAGLGYLPAFVTADRRAVHDRISGTRVVRAR